MGRSLFWLLWVIKVACRWRPYIQLSLMDICRLGYKASLHDTNVDLSCMRASLSLHSTTADVCWLCLGDDDRWNYHQCRVWCFCGQVPKDPWPPAGCGEPAQYQAVDWEASTNWVLGRTTVYCVLANYSYYIVHALDNQCVPMINAYIAFITSYSPGLGFMLIMLSGIM